MGFNTFSINSGRYFDYKKNDRDYPDENKNKILQTIKARGKLVWPKTDLML